MKKEEDEPLTGKDYLIMTGTIITIGLVAYALIAIFSGDIIQSPNGLPAFNYAQDYKEQYNQLQQDTHQKMPDEIIPQPNEECIQNKTIEYFNGFEAKEQKILETIKEEQKEATIRKYENDGINRPCFFQSDFKTDNKYNVICIVDANPIQNRTYCTKTHIIRTR